MVHFKYVKRGVKRKHRVLAGMLAKLEAIARLEGVDKVIPATISYSPGRRVRKPALRLTRETGAGFKLLAQSKDSIQEIFLVVSKERREEVKSSLESLGVFVPARLQRKDID